MLSGRAAWPPRGARPATVGGEAAPSISGFAEAGLSPAAASGLAWDAAGSRLLSLDCAVDTGVDGREPQLSVE